jgi:hypothetical protein
VRFDELTARGDELTAQRLSRPEPVEGRFDEPPSPRPEPVEGRFDKLTARFVTDPGDLV